PQNREAEPSQNDVSSSDTTQSGKTQTEPDNAPQAVDTDEMPAEIDENASKITVQEEHVKYVDLPNVQTDEIFEEALIARDGSGVQDAVDAPQPDEFSLIVASITEKDVSDAGEIKVSDTLIDDVPELAEKTQDDLDDNLVLFAVGSVNQTITEQVPTDFVLSNEKIEQTSETGEPKSKQILAEIPTVTVQDERTVSAEAKSDGNFVHSVSFDGNGNATMDMSLNHGVGAQNTGLIINENGSVQQHTVTNAQQFGTMLSGEIQSNSAELVKTGSIILRDGNSGTINLVLHPEELGNVKIHLEISDNILSGRITVASEEAYNAFKANLSSLRDSFIANGFDTAGFDLSWSGEQHSDGEQQGEQGKNPFGNTYDGHIAVVSDDVPQGVNQAYASHAYVNVMI
ncbi:MAG: flagellar hook-length control protein FliK, partial [Spirochaetales bacterium]